MPIYEFLLDWFAEWHNVTNKTAVVEKFDANRDKYVSRLTNIIWGNVQYVGCGIVKQSHGGITLRTLLCLYGPGGNVDGAHVYTPSRTEVKLCPNGTVIDETFPSICRVLIEGHWYGNIIDLNMCGRDIVLSCDPILMFISVVCTLIRAVK